MDAGGQRERERRGREGGRETQRERDTQRERESRPGVVREDASPPLGQLAIGCCLDVLGSFPWPTVDILGHFP